MQSPLKIFYDKKSRNEKIAMISLYDAPTATIACDANADVLLVGDSLGNVILGYESTLHVTLEDMTRHTGAVARGVKKSARPNVPIVADLPFGYCGDNARALHAAVALMQAGAHAVKLEGASIHNLHAIDFLVNNGVPVMAHLGFTPQSAMQKREVVQGRTKESAKQLYDQAQRVQDVGCFGVVLETVALEAARKITDELSLVTIGIGSGPDCDGQVLVWHDLVGLSPQTFRFVKRFGEQQRVLSDATQNYVNEVHDMKFPTQENGWPMKELLD